jgi:Xaa-Pro aminopeptidase
MTTKEKLIALRTKMKERGLQAYIIFSSDPHGSEYVSDHWRCRSWISGFTGSAGTVVVTLQDAGLWTDFRYFIQATEELKDSGIKLFKMGEPGVPPFIDWLADSLEDESVVGMDGRTLTLKDWEAMAVPFTPRQIRIDGQDDLIGELWLDRPSEALEPVWLLSDEEAGVKSRDKISDIRRIMTQGHVDATIISSLDDIAWILNMRGGDVPYNPVIQSFLYISLKELIWFVDDRKLDESIHTALQSLGVQWLPYGEVEQRMSMLESDITLYVSPERSSSALISALPEGIKVVKGIDFSTRLKAEKNQGEQKRIRKVMEKDGVALVRFIIWLRRRLEEGVLSELEAAKALKGFRSEQDGFFGESFSPIPAYKAHGAICHYEAKEQNQFFLEKDSLFLIDSGGQYKEGTTDITRTLALGAPTEREILDYTLVLKGHIALSQAVFPAGTRGYQLDILARMALWNAGLNYGHGTGHGVGYILNVHEGPQKISPHPIDETLRPGMVCSNEPGIYREGQHGIRIENLILVQPWTECPENETFYRFETLSLCPYERSLIDSSLLTRDEIGWVNNYQEEVFRRLSPLLGEKAKSWLREETLEIT